MHGDVPAKRERELDANGASRRPRAGIPESDFPHRPADTPTVRRYLAEHPDASDLDADALTEHAYQQARKHFDSIQRRIQEFLLRRED